MRKILAATITAILLGLNQSAMADLTTGLAAHYTFDNCQATDSSGNGNNGTITGKLKCINGIDNKALLFDGASYISVPSSASLNPVSEWTMAFWIRVDDINNEFLAVIHKGGVKTNCYYNREYSVWIHQNRYFTQSVAGDTCNFPNQDSKTFDRLVGRWLHYVNVIDRNNKHVMKTYINGRLNVEQADSESGFKNNNANLWIGSNAEIYSLHSPFKGALDDIRFYNRALSDTEIQELYNTLPVSGGIRGLRTQSVTCTNTTTGESKTIALPDGRVGWNCESAGLTSNPGDLIDIHLNGVSWGNP
ncbi:hypothetical protein JCM14076_05830 [Methylosoma difficile]